MGSTALGFAGLLIRGNYFLQGGLIISSVMLDMVDARFRFDDIKKNGITLDNGIFLANIILRAGLKFFLRGGVPFKKPPLVEERTCPHLITTSSIYDGRVGQYMLKRDQELSIRMGYQGRVPQDFSHNELIKVNWDFQGARQKRDFLEASLRQSEHTGIPLSNEFMKQYQRAVDMDRWSVVLSCESYKRNNAKRIQETIDQGNLEITKWYNEEYLPWLKEEAFFGPLGPPAKAIYVSCALMAAAELSAWIHDLIILK